ncbi:UPF0496 protein 1-like [Punica granatum]|uniref:Uncharacterized protein n=2 Tax=Punica granatum TaxID=22663 RepID=A0A218XVY4_PUNGR|nr:UPF0496 protein 1-like [Punica granatum]OWM89207.1 hypothetical protein CDL15_Pgr010493 [Punica granatum]PKI58816.1 hypothetical protein CRG98_020806 [Punica granatum]
MGNTYSRSPLEVPFYAIGFNANVKYNPEELTSYEEACLEDRDLRSFDAKLRDQTSHVIGALADGVEGRSLSFDSFKEVTGCLLDMNQQVVKVVLECKKDIWKSQELFNLVEDYLKSSLQTLDFCSALDKCLNRTRDAQLSIHVALQHFEEEHEREGEQNKGGSRYARTLEELRRFRAAGDPFTEEFFQIFQSVYKQQVLMLQKLQLRRSKLDKKLRYIRAWRKVSSMIFIVTFTALLICSVVAAAVAAPTVAAALAAAVPAGSMGKVVDQLWKNYENAVKSHKEVVRLMQVGTSVVIKDLEGIRALIDRLEVEIGSLLEVAELATERSGKEGEGAVKLAVEEIRRNLSVFGKKVDDLQAQTEACGRDVRRARTVVLQRMIRNTKR